MKFNGDQISYRKGDISYRGCIVTVKTNLQYVLMYPENMQDDKQLIVESLNYNTEDRNIKDWSDRGVQDNLMNSLSARMEWVKDAPILMPIVPHDKTYTPYYQQLSRDCFTDELAGKREFERIDLKYLDCIQDAKDTLRKLTGKRVTDKVFINGYSSSGVFAQRFALIHPEVVDKCCVGGSAGSIPIPEKNIGYPVGIADFKELFGKEFNEEAYKNIEFAYYVGEHEASNPGNWDIDGNVMKKDEHGNKLDKTQIEAPMHDMSYHGHSTPKDIGEKQREAYGISLNDRFKNSIQYYKEHGYKIHDMIYKGAGHRSMFNSKANRFAGKVIKDIIDFYRGNPSFEFDSLSSVTKLDMSEQRSRETHVFTPPFEKDLENDMVAENTNNGEFRINEFGEIERTQSKLEALANQKKKLESLLRERQSELKTKQANMSLQQKRESYEKTE